MEEVTSLKSLYPHLDRFLYPFFYPEYNLAPIPAYHISDQILQFINGTEIPTFSENEGELNLSRYEQRTSHMHDSICIIEKLFMNMKDEITTNILIKSRNQTELSVYLTYVKECLTERLEGTNSNFFYDLIFGEPTNDNMIAGFIHPEKTDTYIVNVHTIDIYIAKINNKYSSQGFNDPDSSRIVHVLSCYLRCLLNFVRYWYDAYEFVANEQIKNNCIDGNDRLQEHNNKKTISQSESLIFNPNSIIPETPLKGLFKDGAKYHEVIQLMITKHLITNNFNGLKWNGIQSNRKYEVVAFCDLLYSKGLLNNKVDNFGFMLPILKDTFIGFSISDKTFRHKAIGVLRDSKFEAILSKI